MTRTLDAIATVRGYPETIVLDNGPEMISSAMLRWAADRGVRLHHIAPGKPIQNAFCESFNGRLATNASTSTTSFLWLTSTKSSVSGVSVATNTDRTRLSAGERPRRFANSFATTTKTLHLSSVA